MQGPWLFHNGARVLAAGQAEKEGKAVRQRFTVALVQGDNRLEVKAASGDGSWESEPASLTLRYEKPLDKPTLYVVAVGVSEYAQDSLQAQVRPAPTPRPVADLFQRRGKAPLPGRAGLGPCSTRRPPRTRSARRCSGPRPRPGPQDTLLLFLAGHGALVGQRYYFIPHDFEARAGKGREDDVREQGLAADVLGDFLAGKAARSGC